MTFGGSTTSRYGGQSCWTSPPLVCASPPSRRCCALTFTVLSSEPVSRWRPSREKPTARTVPECALMMEDLPSLAPTKPPAQPRRTPRQASRGQPRVARLMGHTHAPNEFCVQKRWIGGLLPFDTPDTNQRKCPRASVRRCVVLEPCENTLPGGQPSNPSNAQTHKRASCGLPPCSGRGLHRTRARACGRPITSGPGYGGGGVHSGQPKTHGAVLGAGGDELAGGGESDAVHSRLRARQPPAHPKLRPEQRRLLPHRNFITQRGVQVGSNHSVAQLDSNRGPASPTQPTQPASR